VSALLVAAGVVFLAELGDKTQLLAMSLATRHRPLPVLAGVSLGYAACNLVSVVVGGLLGAALPTTPLRIGGGLLFLWFAWRAWRDDEDDDEEVEVEARHVVRSVAAAMFVAELGDKTMLTTATLAAQDSPVLTWIGATLGITACGALAVFVGRWLGDRVPPRATRTVSVILFATFGVLLLASAA
jgi:putative Ca2+/H+ antiporter (TMEM165/GDT1 family)